MTAPQPGTSLVRRVIGGLGRRLARSAGASMDDFGPMYTNAGWSVVTGQSPETYERTGRNIRIQGFERNPVVAACMRVITESLASVPIEIYREDKDGETTVLPAAPALDPLMAPRVNWSAFRLRLTTAAHILSYGNAFWMLERPGRRRQNDGRWNNGNRAPSGIRIVHPERIQYVFLDPTTEEPTEFHWVDRLGRVWVDSWEDVIHFKDVSLAPDAMWGFPRAAAAMLDIVTDGEATEYVRQILTNNGSPALIIGLKNIVSEDQARKADERFHEKAVGRGERGRVRFLPGVEIVQDIGFTLENLEFPALRSIVREDICAVFGVDPRMIGLQSARGVEAAFSGGQYEEARRRLFLQTIGPLMTLIESELDLNYCPEWGNVRARFSPDAIAEITEDESATSTRVLAQMTAGARTREETRKAIGLPEAMNPTDTLVGTMARQEYPVAEQFVSRIPPIGPGGGPLPAGAAPADPNNANDAGNDGGAKGNLEPSNTPPEPSPEPDPQTGAPDPKANRRALSRYVRAGMTLTDEQRRALWEDLDTRARSEESAYYRAAILQFNAEAVGVRRTLLDAVPESQRSARAVDPETDPFIAAALERIQRDYGKDGPYYRAWIQRYLALISRTFETSGQNLAEGLGVEFTLENPNVQAALVQRVQKLAGYVTQETAKQVTAAIQNGRNAGLGVEPIADLIQQGVFGQMGRTRALRIAQTETIGALNQGEYLAANQTGVVQSKEWLTQGDDKVRDSHRINAAQGWVAMDATFPDGVMYPGDQQGAASEVINCRCGLLYSDQVSNG